LRGMGDACRALDFPIVSGNVSLYNESKATGGGSAILPTPAIGGVGLLDDWEKSATIGFKAEGEAILLIGADQSEKEAFWLAKYHEDPHRGPPSYEEWRELRLAGKFARWGEHLGQSLWLREIHGLVAGTAPFVDLDREKKTGEFVRRLVDAGRISSAHDVSDGGILVAVAEMALAGSMGAMVQTYGDVAFDYFAEDQGRYLATARFDGEMDFAELYQEAQSAGVAVEWIGATGGNSLRILGNQDDELGDIRLAELRAAHEGFFPRLMGADAALA